LRNALPINYKDPELKGFRRQHHYISKLKNWASYKSTFDYLDSKSQGLLATSGILGAVFLLAFEQSLKESGVPLFFDKPIAFYGSALGFILIVLAAVLLMQCFSARADRFIHGKQDLISEFEEGFGDKTEVELEAQIDAFVALYTDYVFAVPSACDFDGVSEKRVSEAELLRFWMCFSGHWTGTVPSLEELCAWSESKTWRERETLTEYRRQLDRTDRLFRSLRFSVESEITRRRWYYMAAYRMIFVCLGLLAISMISLMVVSWGKVF